MLYKVPVTFIHLPGQRFSPRYGGCTPIRECHSARTTTRPTLPPTWIFNQSRHQPFHPSHRHNDLPSALSDVIGLLDLLPGWERNEQENGCKHPRQEWVKKIPCPGFSPEEVSVKVSGGKVLIHARHEDGEGDNLEVRELRRTIAIPSRVNVDELTGTLTDDGILSIHAPMSSTGRPQNTQKTNREGQKEQKCEVTCACPMTGGKHEDQSGDGTHEDQSGEGTYDVKSREGTHGNQSGEGTHEDQSGEGTHEDQSGKAASIERKLDQDSISEDTCKMVPVESQHGKNVSENTGETVVVCTGHTTPEHQSLGKDNGNMDVAEPDNSRTDVEKKQFQIDVDMNGYNPDTIEVKLSDNTLTVFVSRVTGPTDHVSRKTIYRTFVIPPNVNADLLTSTLNGAGQLVISGPYMEDKEPTGRTIPVNVEQ